MDGIHLISDLCLGTRYYDFYVYILIIENHRKPMK